MSINYTYDRLTLNFNSQIYQRLEQNGSLNEFIDRLKALSARLPAYKDSHNINPDRDKLERGIHLLGIKDSEFDIFPTSDLVLKCSEGQPWAENLKRQFDRSMQLAQDFDVKLSYEESKLLKICPVYLHLRTSAEDAFFKQILFMQRIEGAVFGDTETGFDSEFCRVFNIPTFAEIRCEPRFALHRWLDRNKRRQLIKIQTAYLFQRLWQRGIRILSLNQKNILASTIDRQLQYTIIDPVPDYARPISPAYNLLTSKFCA